MIPAVVTDHTASALGYLTQRFQGKPVIGGIVSALASKCNDLESMLWDVLNKRILANTPIGDQLDQLGAVVGEPRDGRSDADYLPAVQVRIRVNRSQGRAEDVLQVADLVFPVSQVWSYFEFPHMGFYVTALNYQAVKSLLRLLGQTKAAGSRGIFVYTTWPPGEDFVYGSTTGSVSTSHGYSDIQSGLYFSTYTSAQDMSP